MQEIKVKELRPHPKNDYFFDDVIGQKWTEFLESVKTSGIIEPIVITQEKVIVSGHQRVRACKELGIETILAEVKIYDDEERVVKDLIETNVRQRGDVSSSSLKMGRIICELEKIYGVKNGGDRRADSAMLKVKNQADIRDALGLDRDTYAKYKKLTTLIPELQDMVEEESVSFAVASRVLARLSKEDQQAIFNNIGKEQLEQMTQAQVQKYVNELLEKDNVIAGYRAKLESKDESNNDKIVNLKSEIEARDRKLAIYEEQKKMLEKKAALNGEDAERYKKLKSDIEFLTKQKNDIGRQIDSARELADLVAEIKSLLEKKLAPIKFMRCMEALDGSDVVVSNLSDMIDMVDSWVYEIRSVVPNKNFVVVNN